MLKAASVVSLLLAGILAGVVAPTASSAPAVRTCHGHRATIVKGARGTLIIGTRHRDVIWAGAGNDRVFGRGGNDLICGGRGRDDLEGGPGQDVVYGGHGKDVCFAPTTREHMLHHGCEVHIGAPVGRRKGTAAEGRPSVAATATSVAAPPLPVITPRMMTSSVAQECSSDVCWAGVPICGGPLATPKVDFETHAPEVVSLHQGALVEVAAELDLLNDTYDGGLSYLGPTTQYSIPTANQIYLVPPQPAVLGPPLDDSDLVFVWFNEYDPATQQWGGWFYKQATKVISPLMSYNEQCVNGGGGF